MRASFDGIRFHWSDTGFVGYGSISLLRLLGDEDDFSFLGFDDRRGRGGSLFFVVEGGTGDVGRFPLIRREGGRGDEAEADLAVEILVGEELLSLRIGDFDLPPMTILGFGEAPRDLLCGRESSGSVPMS